MKYFTPIIALFIFINCASKQVVNENEILINSTSLTNVGNDYEMKISKIISDSRCPEGVSCIWEGQVEMTVGVYKGRELVEEKDLIVNSKTIEENATWASQYSKKPVKFIGVLPSRVKDTPINEGDYKLLLKYD